MISQDPRRSTLDPLLNRRTLMLRALGASVALGARGACSLPAVVVAGLRPLR